MPIITERPASEGKVSALIPDMEEVTLTIIDAQIEDDKYAEPDEAGELPRQLCITWELQADGITRKQRTRGVQAGKRIWQRMRLYYYIRHDGLPTVFKDTVDNLQGYVNGEGIAFVFDPETFEDETDILVGIKAACVVEQYAKKKGPNKGQLDNRIAKVKPLEDEDEEPAPAPAPVARPVGAKPRGAVAPAVRNRPQPIDENEPPF